MTWIGEQSGSGIMIFTTDGLPSGIPYGTDGQTLKMRGDTPVFMSNAAGTFTVSQAEIDFGSTPVAEAYFEVINPSIEASHKVLANMSYDTPTDKDRDELEMDDLSIRCAASGGGFIAFIRAIDGSYLEGKFKIDYTFS